MSKMMSKMSSMLSTNRCIAAAFFCADAVGAVSLEADLAHKKFLVPSEKEGKIAVKIAKEVPRAE
jgi:hypothetical protein